MQMTAGLPCLSGIPFDTFKQAAAAVVPISYAGF